MVYLLLKQHTTLNFSLDQHTSLNIPPWETYLLKPPNYTLYFHTSILYYWNQHLNKPCDKIPSDKHLSITYSFRLARSLTWRGRGLTSDILQPFTINNIVEAIITKHPLRLVWEDDVRHPDTKTLMVNMMAFIQTGFNMQLQSARFQRCTTCTEAAWGLSSDHERKTSFYIFSQGDKSFMSDAITPRRSGEAAGRSRSVL